MKLWLKISLICTAVLLLIVGACSTLLLLTTRDTLLKLTIDSARTEQANLENSFTKMVGLYDNNNLEPIVKSSLVQYCFKSFTNGPAALLLGQDTIYSDISFDPADLLPQLGLAKQEYVLSKVNGRDVLVIGSKATSGYTIYTVRDITSVYGSISKLILQFGAISIFCIMIGITLIIILMFVTTKPLKQLSLSVKRIAQGKYTERVQGNTNDEIGELAQNFNSMAGAVQTHVEALQEISQRQQLFIGSLTHEFKTPLTSVIGHSETLLYTNMPEDVVQKSLLYIHEQCTWLERLTQKLLKLITLQEGIELSQELVEPLLDAVRDSVAETLTKRGILLEYKSDIQTLPMDYDLMLSLLINLVDNAAKASREGQTVRVHAHDSVIEVIDQGIGIPEAELSRVTEPFYMVDKSRSKKMGGVGLGLALVKRIADAHGATISIVSVPGQGTTVKVAFPDNKTFTIS